MWRLAATTVSILLAGSGVGALQSVLVCGGSKSSSGGVAVSELVASCLDTTEVVRWYGSEEMPTTKCDAAVVCGDGASSSLEELVTGMLSARRGVAPSTVVLVSGVEPEEKKRGLLGGLLEKEPTSVEALASLASEGGAKRVAIVRHGPLFGGDLETPAFSDGLRRSPQLSADFARRAVRLAPWREDSAAQQPTRRATVARVAAETLARLEDDIVDLEVKSALGPEPTEDQWRQCVVDALAASDPRCAFRLSTAKRDVAPAILQDWLLNTWGPLVLRGLSAKYSTVGARPVAFDSKGDDVILRWEEFDGTQVSTVGTLTFSLQKDVFLVTRESDRPLPGEIQLVDSLADALPSQFPLIVEEEQPAPVEEKGAEDAAAAEEDVVLREEEEEEEEEQEQQQREEEPPTPPSSSEKEEEVAAAVAAPKKKARRSSVRARTSPAATTGAPPPKQDD